MDRRFWRVSCVEPSSGTRIPCSSPFVVCLGGESQAALTIETTNCAQVTSDDAGDIASECTCPPTEVAISGGTYTGNPDDMISLTQVGPSFGGSAQVWRVACSSPGGSAIACQFPFAVCVGAPYAAAARVETANCAQVTSDDAGVAEECTCQPTEVAIAGGASAGTPSNMLSGSQAGTSFGGSAKLWRVSCVNGAGTPVACSQPFAVCAGSGI